MLVVYIIDNYLHKMAFATVSQSKSLQMSCRATIMLRRARLRDYDMRDFAIAIGDDINNDGQQARYQSTAEYLKGLAFAAGWGNRSTMDHDGCLNELQAGIPSDSQDNFAKNVMTFGQEWCRADAATAKPAFYPVQSEADILFTFSHATTNNDTRSGIGPFTLLGFCS